MIIYPALAIILMAWTVYEREEKQQGDFYKSWEPYEAED